MNFIRHVIATLSTPSKFERDWYGWFTNQMSHMTTGVFGVWIICVISFLAHGDFPEKEGVFYLVLILYGAKEIFADTWQGWDTIEDILFLVVYGSGGTLVSMTESEVGSPDVSFNIFAALPFLCFSMGHLAFGSFIRWRRAQHG